MQMPPTLHGHALKRDETKNRKCMVCGTLFKSMCACGKAICGSKGGVTCWSWHMEAVALGTDAEQPLQLPRESGHVSDGVEPLYRILCV
jgi:hypothetical protein